MAEKTVTIRPYRKGEEVYVAQAQKKVYADEYRWGSAFCDYAEKIAYDFASAPHQDNEELWVAEKDGGLVGCIMLCQTEEPGTGQLRLFLVDKTCRQGGVGSALTKALMEKAGACGYRKLILWTASPLTAAIHHYEKMGFRKVEQIPNDSWSLDGERLYEEKYELELSNAEA